MCEYAVWERSMVIHMLEVISKKCWDTVTRYVKWTVLGSITGIVVGLIATLFATCLEAAAHIREGHPYTFLTLPIGGVIIVTLYKITKMEHDSGTDNVINSIHEDVVIPLKLTFLIFASTVITIFCGGSVGREGAALQMGASLGNTVSRTFRFGEEDKKILIMSGMAAAFGALFHTPMAAAFFSMEVASIGMMHYAALVPCILASTIAYSIIKAFGIPEEYFPAGASYDLTLNMGARILILAIFCALVSMLFCASLQLGEKILNRWIHDKYVKIIAGSLILIVLNCIVGTTDYQGTGVGVIGRALEGNADTWAFLLKLIFTVVTISAGFKGGEIVPSFFIGATFGCVIAGLLGIPATLGASVGMIAVFCGVTNCPVASLLIAIELFGVGNVYFYMLAIATSYMLSGYVSLYHTQIIVFSKNEEKQIKRSVGHLWSKH